MAYVAVADFRAATLADYCYGLELTTAEAPNDDLAAAIARQSELLDEWCNDHFEPTTGTHYIDVRGRSQRLYVPRRLRSIDQLATIADDGTVTVQPPSAYRLRGDRPICWVDVVGDGLEGVASRWYWPEGTATVRIQGDWDWAETPGPIRRATALLVWDGFAALRADLRRASRWSDSSASYEAARTQPSGIPEVDAIIAQYRRELP